jgi:AcrR family transcriptional regulator
MTTRRKSRRRGRPSKTERSETASREALLASAAAVFAARGYGGATVEEIIDRAGLSKGTFYWNFDGKDDVFRTLIDERLAAPARGLIEITRTAPADRPSADEVGLGLAQLFTGERDFVLLLHEYWAAAARDRRIAARYRSGQQALREALADALTTRHERTGVPMTLTATELAQAFIALWMGLSLDAVLEREDVAPALLGEILSLVYDGMVHRMQTRSG